MPDNNEGQIPVLELKSCSRCGNPFMVKKGEDLPELVCDNCIELEKIKRELQIGVFEKVLEVKNKMDACINEMTNSLRITRGQFNKQFFLEKIKKRAELLKKSLELIEKIEESTDEKYVEEYTKLFEKMKREYS